MDKEHIKAAAAYAKGAIEEAVGDVMDDSKLEADSELQRAVEWAKASDGAKQNRSPAELHADGPMN